MRKDSLVVIFSLVIFSVLFSTLLLFAGKNNKEKTYVITVPNPCVKVSKTEKGKIYLTEEQGVCIQKLSTIQVKVEPDDNGKVEIYYRGTLWKVIKPEESLEDMIDNLYNIAVKELLSSMPEPGKNLSSEDRHKIEEALNKTSFYVNSPEFKNRVESYKSSLYSLLFGNTTGEQNNFYEDLKRDKNSVLSDDERLYIFVSESVPVSTVRNFVRDASLLRSDNVLFVLRGGIGGLNYLRPTIEWVYTVLIKDQNCDLKSEECEVYPVRFVIDPFLFRRYRITEVPAVVYVRGIKPLFGYSEGLKEVEIGDYYVSYGDTSLFYHLYVIGKSSGNTKLISFSEPYLKF